MRRTAEVTWAICLLLNVVWAVLSLAMRSGPSAIATTVAAVAAFQTMITIGVLIVRAQPRNAEGWLFCVAPLLMVAGNLLGTYGEYALLVRHGTLPGGVVASAFGNLWLIGAALYASFLILLFPDGRLPGRRWRPIAWAGGMSLTALSIGLLVTPGKLDAPLERFDRPFAVEGLQHLALGGLLVPVLIVAGLVGAVVRYRRGTVLERQQLRWFVATVLGAALVLPLLAAFQSLTGKEVPGSVILLLMMLMPVSVGMAILRHQLYGIEVLIRRTIVYGVLIAALTAIYLGGIAGIGVVFRATFGDAGTLSVALSTLATVAAFQPLRTRVRRVVERRFYRERYDAAGALDAVRARFRDEIDVDELQRVALGVITDALRPTHASLWLRP